MNKNQITLESYENGISEYVAGTSANLNDNLKRWIDKALNILPLNAKIMEIGSAFGRDADYIESKGYLVERTDATHGFVSLLKKKGHQATVFNILKDDFSSTYDLIFANAVFLHFSRSELQTVLKKNYTNLNKGGILAFSVKHGEGEEWTTAKIGHPRYFCYWQPENLRQLLESNGFTHVEISQNENFLLVTAQKPKGEAHNLCCDHLQSS